MIMSSAWIVLLLLHCASLSIAKPPHIVLIVADDLGFNDVSWHNPDILSPNLEGLARGGLILENAYVMPICSPTRSALMTGYHPIRTGRQSSVIWQQEPVGLYANFTLMPQRLKELGYRTHAIGKWHLGFCNEAYLPTRRGFDSFNGFWLGSEDYYKHDRPPSVGGGPKGYDFRADEEVDRDANNTYSSYLLANHATRLIFEHSANHSDRPMFLYLPFQDTHSPLQAPDEFVRLYPNVKNDNRRVFSGMVSALDSAVGRVMKALKTAEMYNNTIVVFTADNGGQVLAAGNNYPLRGNKATLWEGGTRASSFVHAPFLKHKGKVHHGLIHVTDWLPTLYSAAGGDPSALGDIDGIDQWPSLVGRQRAHSPRTEMLYNIEPKMKGQKVVGKEIKNAAIRVGEMKLLVGNPGQPDGWVKPDQVSSLEEDQLRSVYNAIVDPLLDYSEYCGQKVQLYNLTADPTEHHDVAKTHPHVVRDLLTRIAKHQERMIAPNVAAEVEAGNPNGHGGVFATGWCAALPRKTEIESADDGWNVIVEGW